MSGPGRQGDPGPRPAPALERDTWADIFAGSALPTAVVVQGEIRWVNRALCELVGSDEEDLVGRPISAAASELDPAELDRAFEGLRRGEPSIHLEGRLGRGERGRWVRIGVTLLDAPDPRPALVQVVDLSDLDEARRELVASERRLRRLLHSIRDNVTVTDAEATITFSTGGAKRALGYTADEWEHLDLLSLVHYDDVSRCVGLWEQALREPGAELSTEVRARGAGGAWNDVALSIVNRMDDPAIGGMVVTTRNVSDLRRAHRLAASQNAVLELIATGSPLEEVLDACVRLVDDNLELEPVSAISLVSEGDHRVRAGSIAPSLSEWFSSPGRPRGIADEALATGVEQLDPDIVANETDPELRRVAATHGFRAAWCVPLDTARGATIGVLGVLFPRPHEPGEHDRHVVDVVRSLVGIALGRAAAEQELAHHALHDTLTGLPNRTLLGDRIERALSRRRRTGSEVAVLFCDIDRFKVVNDSLGHGIGDELLTSFADRLGEVVDQGDTLARFGGDEFVILLEDVRSSHHPVTVAERIASALQEPFRISSGQDVHLTASIGLTTATEHEHAGAWLRDADAAMAQAKERGRNRFELFDTAMRDAAISRLDTQNDLRHAIRHGSFVVHYQPVIDLRTGRITGAEALVRWEHPRRGLVPPLDFVPVAEDTGLIHELGAFVLDRAVGDMAGLCGRLGRQLELGVNVSARQLSNLALREDIDEVCERHGWPRHALLLEITESTLAEGASGTLDLLRGIHELGIDFAIDDFGTGHSSLDRLGRMPVDQVKIDRSFVRAIDGDDQRMVRIVDAVVGIAEALALSTTAEGVETPAQLEYLRRVGCDLAQGYLFARPVPLDELEALVRSDPAW